jgi:hypothetical protein
MTKEEEIIEMARRAGFIDADWNIKIVLPHLEAFAKLVAEKALREALAQPKEPEQEPVAWMIWGKNNVPSLTFKKPSDKYVFDSLYTAPPQRTWVRLTYEEADKLWESMYADWELMRITEAKLKQKNTRGQE